MTELRAKKEDNETVLAIHSLGIDLSEKHIKSTFSNLVKWIIYAYLDNKNVHIPYLGELIIDHSDDNKDDDGHLKANVQLSIKPTSFIRKTIGQLDDGKITDIDKYLLDNIAYSLELKLEE